eukprot:5313720-Pleurochrysis_carterae.AAC.1
MAQVLGAAHRAPRGREVARKPHCPRRHLAGGTLAVQGTALIASSAMPEAPHLRASLLATLCLLYVSGFRKAELV